MLKNKRSLKKVKTAKEEEDEPTLSFSREIITVEGAFEQLSFCCCEYSEGPVGLTFIYFEKPVKCHMDIRGGWPAYTSNQSTNEKQMIDGICVAGGSALGLEAAAGITSSFWKRKSKIIGLNAAVIYSHNLEYNKIYPDKRLGEFAANHLGKQLYSGKVGAGNSASKGQGVTFGKIFDKYHVLCIVVNNSVGVVYKNGEPVSTSLGDSDSENEPQIGKQTTITTVITDMDLDNDELTQMSHQLHASMGAFIRPFNTLLDGDIFYACSTQERKKTESGYQLTNVFLEMADYLEDAIYKSVE